MARKTVLNLALCAAKFRTVYQKLPTTDRSLIKLSNTMVSQNRTEVSMQSFSDWADYFALNGYTTAADLEKCRATVGNRYPEMVLWLARQDKLRPKVLADAAYTAWLKSENPKRCMAGGDWAELFRRSYMAGHELFLN